jgi:hypothetical protein
LTWPKNRTEFGPNRTPVLFGLSDVNEEDLIPIAVDPTSGAILTTSSGGGGGGTSSNFGATFPTAGTAVGATDGTNMQPLTVDASGYLEVNVKAGSASNTQYTELDTTSPATGDLMLGRYVTSLPTLTDGEMNEPMLDSSSRLLVNVSNSSIAVTGTVTANAGTNLNTSALALESGGNLAAIKTDTDTIAGTVSSSKVNVNISSGSIANTSFIVTQGTASNLKAQVVGTGTFAAQVTSSTATGSSVPVDAYYMGISDQTGKLTGAVSANTARGTTGNGLLGVGVLGFDGTDWQYVGVNSNRLKVTMAGATGTPVAGTIYNGQKAVTASAAAIASSQALTQGVTIEALSTNAISVFVGANGVSDSTGIELPPGASITLPINNLNLAYVIASTTGASVSYIGV